ncbi:hypothetical protein U1Q18_026442 [Sarracenia purpurea var. burkii]
MKSGFAFVYMDDERDAEAAIRGLDRIEFGRKGRHLRVEWTKQERGIRRPGNSRRSSNPKPSKSLFVINFDPYNTRTKDLERHFDPYGKILNVRIRKNFAFIQYELEEDATRALDATNLSMLMDRVISVEYAIKDDDERRNGYSPDRSRDRLPGRREHDRGRSPSPYRRGERASPDYGRGRGRGHGRSRSRSPQRRERASPDYGRGPNNPSPPYRRERINSDYDRGQSRSPRTKRLSPDHGRGPSPRERVSRGYIRGRSPSSQRERVSPDGYQRSPSPDSEPEQKQDSPKRDGAESPGQERHASRSPRTQERSGARERSRS